MQFCCEVWLYSSMWGSIFISCVSISVSSGLFYKYWDDFVIASLWKSAWNFKACFFPDWASSLVIKILQTNLYPSYTCVAPVVCCGVVWVWLRANFGSVSKPSQQCCWWLSCSRIQLTVSNMWWCCSGNSKNGANSFVLTIIRYLLPMCIHCHLSMKVHF